MADKQKSVDRATLEMLAKAKADGVSTVFDRAEEMKPCPIGAEGSCCKNCAMGPCRVPAPKKKAEGRGGQGEAAGPLRGDRRNHLRAQFCPHDRRGHLGPLRPRARASPNSSWRRPRAKSPGSKSRTSRSSTRWPWTLGVEIGDRPIKEIAIEVGEKALAEFGRQQGELPFVKRAPLKRQEIWRKLGIVPRGIDREVVELMHRTHMGVDQDYRNLILQGSRCALADGWGGSMIATELQDILFGNPVPVAGQDQPRRPEGRPGQHGHARP